MDKIESKVKKYLLKNTQLMDDLSLLRVNLYTEKAIKLDSQTNKLDLLINDVQYLIKRQKCNRNNVITLYNWIKTLDWEGNSEILSVFKEKLNLYLDVLQQEIIVDEAYVSNVNTAIKLKNYDNNISSLTLASKNNSKERNKCKRKVLTPSKEGR